VTHNTRIREWDQTIEGIEQAEVESVKEEDGGNQGAVFEMQLCIGYLPSIDSTCLYTTMQMTRASSAGRQGPCPCHNMKSFLQNISQH
jgi:hypothetical protein